ncbi:phage/plasmid primase, P4 family [Paraburkholderia sp. BR13444]|uniref:DNA primase family protein n=1 Tax=Paraburkholderia sp. BR13444 TaxID=3236997 RepID=UPI0034D01C78
MTERTNYPDRTILDRSPTRPSKKRTPSKGNGHADEALTVIDPKAPLDVASQFMLTHWMQGGVGCMAFWRSEFWRYAPNGWQQMSTDDVRAELYRLLSVAKHPVENLLLSVKPTPRMVNDVLDALRARAKIDDARDAPFMLDGTVLPAGGVLVVNNGYIELASRTLRPLTPNLFAPSRADFDYEPDSGDPVKWLAFLGEVFDDDPASIALLQEFFGHVLSGGNLYQKALFIAGPKRSGKGTIAGVLTRLIGRAAVASPALHTLGDPFGLAGLLNRSLIVVSDARLTARADINNVVETLLRVIAGDPVDVHRKFLTPLPAVVLPGRILMLSNELPAFADASGAITSRFLILRTRQSFYGRENPKLARELAEELPAILDWALDGLTVLTKRAHFVEPGDAEATRETWDRATSPTAAFVADCCVVGPHCEVSDDLLFGAYEAWCMRQNFKPLARNWFYRDLAPVVATKRRRRLVGGVQKPFLDGIDLCDSPLG